MNLKMLYDIVEEHMIRCEKRHQNPEEIRVCIPITTVNSIGGTPVVDVKQIIKGFDWDNNKLMLYPDYDLSKTDHDYLQKMRKGANDLGWSVYEFQTIKRMNKRLIKEIEQLKQQINNQED